MCPRGGVLVPGSHRGGTGSVATDRVLALPAGGFEVRECSGQVTGSEGRGVYTARRGFRATCGGVRREGAAGLDVALLHDRVLQPLVGGPRPTGTIDPVRAPLTELMSACDGDVGALFTLSPPTLDVLVGIADRGQVMPPKTTYYDTPPYVGIFLRA